MDHESRLKAILLLVKKTIKGVRTYGDAVRNDWSNFDGRECRQRLYGEMEPLRLVLEETEKDLNWVVPEL